MLSGCPNWFSCPIPHELSEWFQKSDCLDCLACPNRTHNVRLSRCVRFSESILVSGLSSDLRFVRESDCPNRIGRNSQWQAGKFFWNWYVRLSMGGDLCELSELLVLSGSQVDVLRHVLAWLANYPYSESIWKSGKKGCPIQKLSKCPVVFGRPVVRIKLVRISPNHYRPPNVVF